VNAGGGGTTGGGGAGGGTAGSSAEGGMDAKIDALAACKGSIMSGSMCSDNCICDNCAAQAVACFSDTRCRNFVDCANRMGCAGLPLTEALACAMTKCPGEFAEAGTAGLGAATAFGNCVGAAMCPQKCAPEGGTEGGGDSAKPDVSSDSTTPDSTTQPDGPNLPDQAAMPDHPEPPDSPPGQGD
jgi:hypothetical protein